MVSSIFGLLIAPIDQKIKIHSDKGQEKFMKKFLMFLCVIPLIAGMTGAAGATLLNGGFETGNLSNLTTTMTSYDNTTDTYSVYTDTPSSSDTATASVVGYHEGFNFTDYDPIGGTNFAELKTDFDEDDAWHFVALSQTVHLEAGLGLAGYAAFDTWDFYNDDPNQFANDEAWVRIYNASVSFDPNDANFYLKEAYLAQPWFMDVETLGDFEDSPWTHWSWTTAMEGDFTVVLGVGDVGVVGIESYALFDSVHVVPEPATMMLLGVGMIGLAGFGRKKFLKK